MTNTKEGKEKKDVKIKDCLLKMDGDTFTEYVENKKQALINISLCIKGEDAKCLIALINLADGEQKLDSLINVIFKAGLQYCMEQNKLMILKGLVK